MPLSRNTAQKNKSSKRHDFFVKEKELATALKLDLKTFDQLIEPLLEFPTSSLSLIEDLHFIYHDRQRKIRRFSKDGALAIAAYFDSLDTIELEADGLRTVLALLEKQKIRKIDASIRRSVLQSSSSLQRHSGLHWLSLADVTKILKTTTHRLNRAQDAIESTGRLLAVNQDICVIEGRTYFSLSGLILLSLELKRSLRSPERQRYCGRVPTIAPPVVEYLALTPAPSPKEIEAAKRFARKRDRQTCQITSTEPSKYNPLKLASHHLFDQATYPVLAADPDNIITISENLHQEFHQWMGGRDKSCMIDDFIQFIELFYASEKSVLTVQLLQRQTVLGEKLKKFLPVTHAR